jgi:pSer/pThr/pTyr-binding forkhead associated (FHA) protein
MTYRLRYLDRTWELGEAPFTVGRNPSCQLTIDSDSLISRRHATFRVTPEGVSVEDLDSRNGVIVNGARIDQEALIHPGDTILIGVQEFTLVADKGKGRVAGAKLAATGIHRVVAPESELAPARVDYVTIGGHAYAVIPKADYVAMRKKLAKASRSERQTMRAPPMKKKSMSKK